MEVVDELYLVGRLVYAALLGSLIGFERELRGYPAGVRTVGLIVLGACLFTEMSRLSGAEDRIAAGIVTGVGFLGAGLIFREGYTVRGITTASTVWAAAAIGMAVGRELLVVAALGTGVVLVWLEARPLVRRLTDFARRWFPAAGPSADYGYGHVTEYDRDEHPRREIDEGRSADH